MPYRIPCDFSAIPGNPKVSLVQALELLNNTLSCYHHLVNNNIDFIHLGFSFLPDMEIEIECYQIPADFDLSAFSKQINERCSPKKITFIQQLGSYPHQVEKANQRRATQALIMSKYASTGQSSRDAAEKLINETILELPIDNPLLHRIHTAYIFGLNFFKRLKYDNALFFFNSALVIYESAPETDQLKELNILSFLKLKATVYKAQNKFKEEQEIYEQILQRISSRLGNENSPVEINLLLIKSLIEQEKFPEASKQLTLINAAHIKISNKREKHQLARFYSYFGFVLTHQNNQDNAANAFIEAKKFFEDAGYYNDIDYAMILLHLALHTFNTNFKALCVDYKNILAGAELAFAAFSILLDFKKDSKIITESNNIGLLCLNKGCNQLAMQFFKYSEQVLANTDIPIDPELIKATLSNITLTQVRIKETENDIENYLHLNNAHQNYGDLIALADLYTQTGNFYDAVRCLLDASKLVDENSPDGIKIQNLLIYHKQNENQNQTDFHDECASESSGNEKLPSYSP